MSEAKSYKRQEASEDYVAEPMAMKYSTVAEDAGYLNDDILMVCWPGEWDGSSF